MRDVQVYRTVEAPREFVERFSDFAISRNPFLAVYEGIIPKLFGEEPTEETLAAWVAEIQETRRISAEARANRAPHHHKSPARKYGSDWGKIGWANDD